MLIKKQQGFTIVELLIVIVVIAILAAITIVAYNGISNRALTASLQTELNGDAKLLQNDRTLSSSDNFPATLDAANNGKGIKPGSGTSYQYRVINTVDPKTYCLTATNGTTSYYIDQTGAVNAGACAGHGAGGVATITNYDNGPTVVGYEYSTSGTTTISKSLTGGPVTNADGQSYRRLTYTSNATSNNLYFCNSGTGDNNVTGNQTYTFSAYVRANWTGTTVNMRVQYSNSTSSYLSTASTSVALSPSTWTRVSYTFTTTADTVNAQSCIYYAAGTSVKPVTGNTIDFAGFMITQGSTLYTYADGSSTNWAWNGLSKNSTSSGVPLP